MDASIYEGGGSLDDQGCMVNRSVSFPYEYSRARDRFPCFGEIPEVAEWQTCSSWFRPTAPLWYIIWIGWEGPGPGAWTSKSLRYHSMSSVFFSYSVSNPYFGLRQFELDCLSQHHIETPLIQPQGDGCSLWYLHPAYDSSVHVLAEQQGHNILFSPFRSSGPAHARQFPAGGLVQRSIVHISHVAPRHPCSAQCGSRGVTDAAAPSGPTVLFPECDNISLWSRWVGWPWLPGIPLSCTCLKTL